MKQILLALFFLSVCGGSAFAQDATTAAQVQEQTSVSQQLFASKILEMNAAISRKVPDLANKLYQDLAAQMQASIVANKAQLDQVAGEEKQLLEEKISRQNSLYSEAKKLSVDLMKNQKDLAVKLEGFKNTL